MSSIYGVHHVQLPIPPNGEELARAFYQVVLRLEEVPKPSELAKQAGLWFQAALFQIHLGVEKDFRASEKAHPAFLVRDLDRLCAACREFGSSVERDDKVMGYRRAHVRDPFGNRIELLETVSPVSRP